MFGKDKRGINVTVGYPTASQTVAFGALTSVQSVRFGDDTVAVELLSPLTTCFIALGPQSTGLTAATTGIAIPPGVVRQFAVKSAKYLAAIGGGAGGGGNLYITELK